MKNIIKSIALVLSLSFATMASAQSGRIHSKSSPRPPHFKSKAHTEMQVAPHPSDRKKASKASSDNNAQKGVKQPRHKKIKIRKGNDVPD